MNPLFFLMLAQAVLQYVTTADTASKQAAAVGEQSRRQETDRQRQLAETQRAAAAEANAEARRRNKDLALFDAVAGEYGGGASVDRARSVRTIQASERAATMQGNESAALGQLGADGVSLESQARTRLASIDQPNPFATALQIGTAYLSTRPKPKPTTSKGTT